MALTQGFLGTWVVFFKDEDKGFKALVAGPGPLALFLWSILLTQGCLAAIWPAQLFVEGPKILGKLSADHKLT